MESNIPPEIGSVILRQLIVREYSVAKRRRQDWQVLTILWVISNVLALMQISIINYQLIMFIHFLLKSI